MTMTPVDGMTWTYDDIFEKAGIDPDLLVLEVDMDDNPHLTQAGKDLVLTGLSTEDREARQHGRYISIGGLIYPEFNEDIHVINPISTPPGWLRFDCMDHGLRNPTAWLFCCVDREGRIIVLDEHYRSGWIVKQHVPIVLAKDALYGEPAYRVGDPSIGNRDPITGTSVQLEYVLNGIPIILGNNDVAGGINRVKTLLRGTSVGDRLVPQLYITNNCVNTIREHKKYRWRKWAHKQLNYEKNQPEEPVKKDDHTADALRYGVASRPEVDDGTTVPDASSLPLGMEAIDPDKPFYDNELVSQGTKYQDFNLGEEY
jgi:hypothetical protein